ncbi:DUF7524 family protein [Haloferacaceae archaeon DSL9]
MSALVVDLNEGDVHAISVPAEFVAEGTFAIELVNHGQPLHVHLHLDDELAPVASLAGANHYVDRKGRQLVRVRVEDIDESVSGLLKIVTSYGARQEYVRVTVEPKTPEKRPVQVDERLSKPQRAEPEEPSLAEELDRFVPHDLSPSVAGFGLGVIFLALAVGVIIDSAIVTLGVGIVIGGVLVAALALLR